MTADKNALMDMEAPIRTIRHAAAAAAAIAEALQTAENDGANTPEWASYAVTFVAEGAQAAIDQLGDLYGAAVDASRADHDRINALLARGGAK